MAFNDLDSRLDKQRNLGLFRKGLEFSGSTGRTLLFDGKEYLNFSSNDYLGLAGSVDLIKAWQKGAELFGVGSGGSFLVTGYNRAHKDLCDQLKSWLGAHEIALFSSGFSANQAIIKMLLTKGDLLLQDKLNHASLIEAGVFCPAKMQRFKHNDLNDLSYILSKDSNRKIDNKLIISEGVFSMDGDCAPICDLLNISNSENAWLMIDDAHGLGVLGANGQGSVSAAGLSLSKLDIYMGTFGKALGVGGAFVAGSKTFIEAINNFSKPYIYSTGIPPAMAYTIQKAALLAQADNFRRDKLAELISTFRKLAINYEIPIGNSNTPIQPIIIGSSERALLISSALKKLGFWTAAIRPPTVPKNSARLRVTLTAAHTIEDVTNLVNALRFVLNENK